MLLFFTPLKFTLRKVQNNLFQTSSIFMNVRAFLFYYFTHLPLSERKLSFLVDGGMGLSNVIYSTLSNFSGH